MLKRLWKWLLDQTTIDEQVEAKVDQVKKEVKHRVERVKEEIADVKEAIVEVANQADDIVDAAKGAPRKGRKPAANKQGAPKKPRANKQK